MSVETNQQALFDEIASLEGRLQDAKHRLKVLNGDLVEVSTTVEDGNRFY